MSDLLTVVMIVKNEASSIEKTLLPFIEEGVSNFLILDTGSTDETIEITRRLFEQHSVNGIIEQKPFVDFATSRNHALEYAEKHFSTTSFFFMLDADWYTKNVRKLLEFCIKHDTASEAVYAVTVQYGEKMKFMSARLFRGNAHIRYVGAVHELPDQIQSKIQIDHDVVCIVNSDYKHLRKSKERYANDLKMLLKDLKKNPASPRTLFYIGQTYECLGDLKNAYKYYLKRSVLKNAADIGETVLTYFRLGYLIEHLAQVDGQFTWDMAMENYMRSFSINPARIEGIVAIASYYINTFPKISYIYLKYAYDVPFPQDFGLIMNEMYTFTRYDLMSRVAAFMGEYELGKEAVENALKAQPNNDLLLQRLAIYNSELERANQKKALSTNLLPPIHKATESMSAIC